MTLRYFPLPQGPLRSGVGHMAGWQITSYFGGRIDPLTGRPGNHGGMDLAYAACAGQPIYAPLAGRVAQSWDPSGGGNWTGLLIDDGSYWGFGHASAFAPNVNGRRVEAGTILAYVGSTGASTGAHLHAAYRPRGATAYADPYDLLADAEHRIVGEDPTTGRIEQIDRPLLTEEDAPMTPTEQAALVKAVTAGVTAGMSAALDKKMADVGSWMWDSRKYDEAATLKIAVSMAKIIHHDLSAAVVALGGQPLPPFTVNIDEPDPEPAPAPVTAASNETAPSSDAAPSA